MGLTSSKTDLDSSRYPKTVCVAVDDSQCSLDALKWATRNFIKNPKDKLLVLNVVRPHGSVMDKIEMWPTPTAGDLQRADNLLERYREEATAAGASNVTPVRLVCLLHV
jgi:Universal stress protein family